jgi:predicted metal-dependent hydrolase
MRYADIAMQLGLPFHDSAPVHECLHAATNAGSSAPAPTVFLSPAIGITPLVFVRHRRARRYVLRLDHEGRVRVTIPRGGSQKEAAAFAARHVGWIARQRERVAKPSMPVDVQRTLRARAAVELPTRLLDLAQQHGLAVTRISIRNQRTRWGSCGRDGHICLNWRLVSMPDWVRDYVLVHELMHLRRLDHSPRYWKLVAAACPEYRQARQWLRSNGPSLR